MEPELRPEYIQKIERIDKEGKFKAFKNIEELRIDHVLWYWSSR